MYLPAELIKKKKAGLHHNKEEIQFIVNSFTDGSLPDYQASAWLMAVCFQGMNDSEMSNLTLSMRDSGRVLDFSNHNRPVIDKHSTGGVGDKTSIIVGPLAAACGVPVAMIAGRGLGHTGGTLDKLESINGFSVDLSIDQFINDVQKHGVSIMGQTSEICPADKKFYALRDVTGTVDSLPLICASIMSKKLAEGISGLVLDVKFGTGAFMKSYENARALAIALQQIGTASNVKVKTLLTNMNQPLGQYIGNSLEIYECLKILQGESWRQVEDTIELSIELVAWMCVLGGVSQTVEEGKSLAVSKLQSGHALETFEKLVSRQGAKSNWKSLPQSKHIKDIVLNKNGYLNSIDCEKIGLASILLGGGRIRSADVIDPSVGIEFMFKQGDQISKDSVLFKIHGNDLEKIKQAESMLIDSVVVSESKPNSIPPLIKEVL